MNKCYYCGRETVSWVGDYTFDECGISGDGIIQLYSCASCGADIEFRIENDQDEPIPVGAMKESEV